MMRSSNPTLLSDPFTRNHGLVADRENRMTQQGVVMKSALLLLFILITAGFTWMRFYQSGSNPASIAVLMGIGVFGGLILALVTVFKMVWAPVTAPLYALCEGLFIGGISALMEAQYPGIAAQAAILTFGTLAAMLAAFQSGLVKATEGFKLGVFAATGGIALVYLVNLVMSFFGVSIPFVWGGGWAGIAFSLFVVVIAALNLVIDFDFIERGVKSGAPKYMEWYGAFALMVTLIWLYIEFLRLLAKSRSR